ncbi:MAG: NAD(P)-dependent oxidoreductase [bacterium]|nr:NAD(P)-dependent oxidoreductase [bacterium]
MSKILITGATGYIGGKAAFYFLRKGDTVCVLVRDRSRLNPEIQQNCEVIIGDVNHPESLQNLSKDIDTVIHSAGRLGTWGVSYQQMYETNAQGVRNLIEACYRHASPRFIHLSAGGVTGPLDTPFVDESYPPCPYTDYEKSKWEGEQIALRLAAERDLNLSVIRPTFTYGPDDPHKFSLFKAVQKGRFAFIGDGNSTIHPVYIDDLLQGIDLAISSTIKQRAIIVGGPRPVTKRELVQTIAQKLGVAEPNMMIPTSFATVVALMCETAAKMLRLSPPLTRSRVIMMSRNWGYSISLAKELLGFQPRFDLNQGVANTVASYRSLGWL